MLYTSITILKIRPLEAKSEKLNTRPMASGWLAACRFYLNDDDDGDGGGAKHSTIDCSMEAALHWAIFCVI